MVPYYKLDPYIVTPFFLIKTIHGFISLGIIVGFLYCLWRADQIKVPKSQVFEGALWILLPGFVGAHLFAVVFCYPEKLFSERWLEILLDYRKGMSSFGGYLTMGLFYWLFVRINKFDKQRARELLDILIHGLVIAFTFGRLSCFFAHDHLSQILSYNFILAVNYPAGPRHNLGLYEFLFLLFILLPMLFRISASRLPAGVLSAVCLTVYGLVRFLLDSLRGYDSRYLSLTPAQYGCILFAVLGLLLFSRIYPDKRFLPMRKHRRISSDN